MLKRFVNFIRMDYASVHFAWKMLSNGKIPTWVIVIYYIILAPILLPLYFPVKWICDLYMKKLLNDITKEEA